MILSCGLLAGFSGGTLLAATRYLIPVVLALPSVIVPLIAMSFLRANRRHTDFGLICRLTTMATLIWVFIATIEAPAAMAALESGLPQTLDARSLTDPFCQWVLLCVPSMPTLLMVLISWLGHTRKRP